MALAKANGTISRVDLLFETVGTSIFMFLLCKNNPLTYIKLSYVISLCALPLLIFLCGEMNRLADDIFDHSENTTSHAAAPPASNFSTGKTGDSSSLQPGSTTVHHRSVSNIQIGEFFGV